MKWGWENLMSRLRFLFSIKFHTERNVTMGDILYQHGTLGTLMAGLLEGTATIQDILKQGDAGLGTLAGSDGEVIFIDGQAFHANAQNEFTQLTGEELTPFATITRFRAHETVLDLVCRLLLEKKKNYHCNYNHIPPHES